MLLSCIPSLVVANFHRHFAGAFDVVTTCSLSPFEARFCAVFGGVYCLRRSVRSLLLSETDDSIISAIQCSNLQKISCSCETSDY